jgi:HPt (histidine-containing phosphotransfer) domain-containing protein
VLELIDSFQSDTASRLQRLHDAICRFDAATVKAEAHSVRGSARQMGADGLADLCQAIESSASHMEGPEQESQVCQAELRFTEVCNDMTAYANAKRAG